ncbi:MAG: prepilin-type N-terminal cleavage/methylation domain-containing protein [Clostridium perfringens]|uniref:prepilin-type N-terminal cleavage/methylation domain-containing protein n=1 Tax=Clostridium perfringens TaxID=1502 RepID=UPI00290996CE|nr:prepilin-type N-terminal cleavage/methylation domain-containing protein [Clostridium perfringens]MDJ9041870.1 prepilin-type N-terminal cleavage/methylation domain-containing protein [Clostridium perfringens]MDJ9049283.1 prepilin-type N-terminal cleavage/methylation domain-containing protein [Clostridium perfringens]MDJ9056508.1 prepilin-type N-terminal cleavage/methylation domain-containing protein [Clostridium perfringens]MDJ9063989.1 prepilin-type N-terminal cleavage/methylation domain-con
MKNLKLKKRGLSLIELVVALSLIAIILIIVGPFFISNYVTLDKTSNQIDFQREAKAIMNYFTDSAMEASNIESLTNVKNEVLSNNNYTESLKKNSLKSKEGYLKLTFNNSENKNEHTTFILKDRSLYMKRGSEEFKIGDLVSSIELTSLTEGVSQREVINNFKNASAIKIEITFDTKKNTPYKVSNILTFRNKN